MRKKEFAAKVISRGSFLDKPYANDIYKVEVVTLRLNPAALDLWVDANQSNTRDMYEDGADGEKEYQEMEAEKRVLGKKFRDALLSPLDMTYENGVTITRLQSEVFSVVGITLEVETKCDEE